MTAKQKWICPHCRQTGVNASSIPCPPSCPNYIAPPTALVEPREHGWDPVKGRDPVRRTAECVSVGVEPREPEPTGYRWDGEAFELQLQEDAEKLFENLATGDGKHSEALDIGLIKAAFRTMLSWASPAVVERAPLEKLAEKWRTEAATEVARLEQYCYGGAHDGEMLDDDIGAGLGQSAQKKNCADELEALLLAWPSSREREK